MDENLLSFMRRFGIWLYFQEYLLQNIKLECISEDFSALDKFLETWKEKQAAFEGLIFMQEPYPNCCKRYKNYSQETVAKYPSIVYADFNLETHRIYRSLTERFNLGKSKKSCKSIISSFRGTDAFLLLVPP